MQFFVRKLCFSPGPYAYPAGGLAGSIGRAQTRKNRSGRSFNLGGREVPVCAVTSEVSRLSHLCFHLRRHRDYVQSLFGPFPSRRGVEPAELRDPFVALDPKQPNAADRCSGSYKTHLPSMLALITVLHSQGSLPISWMCRPDPAPSCKLFSRHCREEWGREGSQTLTVHERSVPVFHTPCQGDSLRQATTYTGPRPDVGANC